MSLKQMLKRLSIFFIFFALFCITNIQNPALAVTPQNLYDKAWKLIQTKYVDETQNQQNWERWRHKYDNVIKDEEDAYVAMATMVDSLGDVYTKFLTPKEYKEESESIQGSLKGIGVQIGVREGKLLIIAPLEDTPGERAGLKSEDEILEIDGKSTKGITVEAAAEKIRGPEGTKVRLLVKRKNEAPKLYTIERANIELKSVSTKAPKIGKVDDNLGYIRLSSFLSKNAAAEFKAALEQLKTKDGIIVDLRSNPGGLLTNSIYIADMLLSSKVIVSTVDRDGYKETQKSLSQVNSIQPVVVLINEGSASASEILAGALKDNKRALIVGKKSFGKGLVQEINKLPDGSALHITIQKYLTPNGTDIHKKGITPDYEVEIKEADVKANKDPQLAKACELLQEQVHKNTNFPQIEIK
ncbi:MAG: S41 family peptidase [Candidatus Gastranaerophilales bacterium]|nr:S41 family peptidase [Candidatus Gastranaerophilales bacterium]